MDVANEIRKRGADKEKIASYAMKNPECIAQLIEGVTAPKGSIRFGYEKVLRLISEQRPELIYPYFDVFKDLSGCDNSFLKWGAIMTIANLAAADSENKFDAIFEEYYAPIRGPVMVSAANIIGSSAKIASSKPYMTQKIVREILKVEEAQFQMHGKPSPECRNVALGHAIDTFDQFFDQIEDKSAIVEFVKRQLKNTRKQVVKKAEKFLKKHNISI